MKTNEMINFVLEKADIQLKKDVNMLNEANEGNDQAVFSLLEDGFLGKIKIWMGF